YSAAILDGIVDAAGAAGYHVLLFTQSWQSAAKSSRAFSDRRTDGIVVVAPLERGDVVPGLVALGLPVTVRSSSTDVTGVPFIAIDNRTGIRLSLSHLRELGHTRIAFAGLGRERVSMRERHDAYLEWMTGQGLPLTDDYVLNDFHSGNRVHNAQ